MNETPPPFLVCAITSFGRCSCSSPSSVDASERRSCPSQLATAHPNARTFASRSPMSLTLSTQVSDWTMVPVDDHRDLVQAEVGGRLQRLPELPLLELAVTGEDIDPARAAGEAVGEHEPARLRHSHPQRAGAGDDLGRRGDVGMARQSVQAAQLVDQLEVELAERRQHRVQARRVMPLGGEVPVALAQHLEVEPGDDVERAEGRAEVAGADALDHVENVQPAGVGEGGCALVRVAVERPDPVEFGLWDVPKRHATASGTCGSSGGTVIVMP